MSGNCLASNNKNTRSIKSKNTEDVSGDEISGTNFIPAKARDSIRRYTRYVTVRTQFAVGFSHFTLSITFSFFVYFLFHSFLSFNYISYLFSVTFLLSIEQISFWFIFGRSLLRISAWTLNYPDSGSSWFSPDKFLDSTL
jgi:hypothetical protein